MKKIILLFIYLLFSVSHNTYTHVDIFTDVRAGNKQAIKKRLENCEDCAAKDEKGNNALHIAVEEGNEEIVEILTTDPSYESFSNWLYSWFYAPVLPHIDELNNNGDSPLLCTVYKGDVKSAEHLLKKGARIEVVNKKGLSAPFAAMIKDDPRFIPLFVTYKLNLERHKHNGDTIFHAAIKEKKPNTIYYCSHQTLLGNSLNNDNKIPAFVAVDTENDEILSLLKKEQFNGATHYAVRNNKYKALNYLFFNNRNYVNEADANGNTPIFYVQDEMMLDFLLTHNADLYKRNKQGEDVLSFVTRNNNIPLINALTKKYNMDINARDNKGQTSLMRAGIEQNYQVMKTLINSGANVRITDNAQETVLHKIARKGDRDGAKIVLENDKRLLTDKNKDGNSPLFIAITNGHMTFAEFLIDAGASLDVINNDGNTIVHEIVKRNSNWLLKKVLPKIDRNFINQKNKNGMSPLLLAADNIETVKTLMEYRVNIYSTDKEGNNIAHIAAMHGNIPLIRLLSKNTDLLNAQNNKGEDVFVHVAKDVKLEMVTLLLTERHFSSGQVHKIICDMHNMNRSYDQQEVYTYLLNLHQNRIKDCDDILAIATITSQSIAHNNTLAQTLADITQQPYYVESFYSIHSGEDLYRMTQHERNNIRNNYVERQYRASQTKNILEQKLQAIVLQEQRKELARIDALKRQTEPERIATQQGTTIVEQKKELDRITADKYAADIAKYNQQVAEEQKAEEQKNISEVAISESDEENVCLVCGEDSLKLLKRLPCKVSHPCYVCEKCSPNLKDCPYRCGTFNK